VWIDFVFFIHFSSSLTIHDFKYLYLSQRCLVGWLVPDSWIHNWCFSCCSWHNPKSGVLHFFYFHFLTLTFHVIFYHHATLYLRMHEESNQTHEFWVIKSHELYDLGILNVFWFLTLSDVSIHTIYFIPTNTTHLTI